MIQRYSTVSDDSMAVFLVANPLGDVVKYEDHRTLLDKANAAIKEAYQIGKKAGRSEGYDAGKESNYSWRL